MTAKQHAVLHALAGYAEAVSARQLADNLERPTARSPRFTYKEVFGQLRALERHGWVDRLKRREVTEWGVTEAGLQALAEHEAAA